MKQSKTFRRISVAIVAVLLITMSVLSVTLAKYTTDFTGEGSRPIAVWNVNVNDTTTLDADDKTLGNFTFAIESTEFTQVNNYENKDMLAPGTSGSFTITVNNESDVAITLSAASFTVSNKPTNLKFYFDSTYQKEITGSTYAYKFGTENNADTLDLGAKGGTTTTTNIVVYWDWAYDSNDATDTADGVAAKLENGNKAMTVTFLLTATQVEPA